MICYWSGLSWAMSAYKFHTYSYFRQKTIILSCCYNISTGMTARVQPHCACQSLHSDRSISHSPNTQRLNCSQCCKHEQFYATKLRAKLNDKRTLEMEAQWCEGTDSHLNWTVMRDIILATEDYRTRYTKRRQPQVFKWKLNDLCFTTKSLVHLGAANPSLHE